MPEYQIEGLTVDFPYEAYTCQLSYMEKVIKCLKEEKNGILESPTGTGKTLCLLCASLAWLQSYKQHCSQNQREPTGKRLTEKLNGSQDGFVVLEQVQIIYASRTHSQLSQAISQLKITSYRNIKTVVLGSRDQLCLDYDVAKLENSTDKISVCREKVRRHQCVFYSKFDSIKSTLSELPIGDIEDMMKHGRQKKFCPYYAAREMKQYSDLIFMPYNYLIDIKARRTHSINLRKCVIIFDEAHNIEQICEESASIALTSVDLAACLEDISGVMRWMSDCQTTAENDDVDISNISFDRDQMIELKEKVKTMEDLLDAKPLNKQSPPDVYPGSCAIEWLTKAGIDIVSKRSVVKLLEDLNTFMSAQATNNFRTKGHALMKLSSFIETVYPSDENGNPLFPQRLTEQINSCFRVFVTEDKDKNKRQWEKPKNSSRILKKFDFMCLSPGYSMRNLAIQNPRSILLTSGTLTPIQSFQTELSIPFDITLQNNHIIKDNQIQVAILTQGVDKEPFNSSHKNRSNRKYVMSLGLTLEHVAKRIPGGALVFFSSYQMVDDVTTMWKIIIEPRRKVAFEKEMDTYNQCVKDSRGCMMLAIARGKVAEGIDFSDDTCRAVIMVGLPYPPAFDPRVQIKKRYQDEMVDQRRKAALNINNQVPMLNGDSWYNQQTYRTINQCVGRAIRHRHDYGSILFFDERFVNTKDQLSQWLRPHVQQLKYTELIQDIREFFKTAATEYPTEVNSSVPSKNTTSDVIGHAQFMPTDSAGILLKDTTSKKIMSTNHADIALALSHIGPTMVFQPEPEFVSYPRTTSCFDAIQAVQTRDKQVSSYSTISFDSVRMS
ncbi:unnamed protein product [Didymodactylos carnosus]|uniref:Helicase ATP-binding domain-containing protein n=1 Tax=Didymodactylos carnosus TaxID=1234261 RepID=A0A8S2GIG9_9BILA|nr:unnamed protein product [Didymodactylos carnosus]CAF3522011.1 unnamed protein product [Didymodactylos carnosus]